MKKVIKDFEEMKKFVDSLIAENKWAVSVIELKDNSFDIQWIERKMYTAHDGQAFPDEIWTTKEGEMICVEDLEPAHAKNVLRMILRNERERAAVLDALGDAIIESITSGDEEFDDMVASLGPKDEAPRVLH